MLAILSPARNIKPVFKEDISLTEPIFLSKAEEIIKELKKLSPWDFEIGMKINEKLAEKTFFEIQDFGSRKKGSAALLSYYGLVYQNLNAQTFTLPQLEYANRHFRILSALYGILNPFDQIFPYRLEMQTKIKINNQSLYAFWKDLPYQKLYETNEVIINLASEEYAKIIRKYLKSQDKWIDIEFQIAKQNTFGFSSYKKIPIVWIKMARGQMARSIIQNRWKKPEDLKKFNWNNYQFEPSLSSERKYVFLK